MVYLWLGALAIILSYLFLSLLGKGDFYENEKYQFKKKVNKQDSSNRKSSWIQPCPLCGYPLRRGERIKSVVFKGGYEAGGVKEQVSHLFGCPYCLPANSDYKRRCPVCNQILPSDGYLIARFFTRKGQQKHHVHVLGCTECRKKHRPFKGGA
ncbi:MAG: hypothetical protein SNJ78_07335 [Spirochaetales bacterium]